MSDIVLTKLTGDDTDPVPKCTTFTIRNFQSLDIELTAPVSHFPLPEDDAESAIIVKAEGNTLLINVAWTLIDETVDVSSEGAPIETKTPTQQMSYWLGRFQPTSMQDKYKITFDGETKEGFIQKVVFSKDAAAPTLYTGRLEFIVGSVVAGEA